MSPGHGCITYRASGYSSTGKRMHLHGFANWAYHDIVPSCSLSTLKGRVIFPSVLSARRHQGSWCLHRIWSDVTLVTIVLHGGCRSPHGIRYNKCRVESRFLFGMETAAMNWNEQSEGAREKRDLKLVRWCALGDRIKTPCGTDG